MAAPKATAIFCLRHCDKKARPRLSAARSRCGCGLWPVATYCLAWCLCQRLATPSRTPRRSTCHKRKLCDCYSILYSGTAGGAIDASVPCGTWASATFGLTECRIGIPAEAWEMQHDRECVTGQCSRSTVRIHRFYFNDFCGNGGMTKPRPKARPPRRQNHSRRHHRPCTRCTPRRVDRSSPGSTSLRA